MTTQTYTIEISERQREMICEALLLIADKPDAPQIPRLYADLELLMRNLKNSGGAPVYTMIR